MNFLCEVRTVLRHQMRLPSYRLIVSNYSKDAEPKDDEVYDEENFGKLTASDVLIDETDLAEREQEIELIRNKSRLNTKHRNMVLNLPSLDETPFDKTLYYSRKQFGRFGSKSGVDPRLCFDTPEEADDKAEYERVAYPYTIQEVFAESKKAKAEKLQAKLKREEKIAQNLTKLDKWMFELNERVARKEREAIEAKKKKELMLEEIRQEFGFKIDQKDPRFQALMEKKELEAKKAKKAAKKAKHEEIVRQRLLRAAQGNDTETSEVAFKNTDENDVAAESDHLPKEKATKTGGKKNVEKNKKKDDSLSASDSESDDENNNTKKEK